MTAYFEISSSSSTVIFHLTPLHYCILSEKVCLINQRTSRPISLEYLNEMLLQSAGLCPVGTMFVTFKYVPNFSVG
jgi:hypothetical protein